MTDTCENTIGGCPPAQPTVIHPIGDSNTIGAVSGTVGAWRAVMYETLRGWRDNFEIIGSLITEPEYLSTFGTWRHSATSGFTMQDEAAVFPSQTANAGPADIILDMLGTNNIVVNGDTADEMLAARMALNAVYRANNPQAYIVIIPPPPFVAGTTVGGNLFDWNTTRADYLALLREWAGTQPRTIVLDNTPLGTGDFITDGVHLTAGGQGLLGTDIARQLDRYLLGGRQGALLPLQFRERAPAYALSIPNGAADRLVSAPDTLFGADASSFAFAIDYYTPTLAGGAYSNVVVYGAVASVPNYYELVQQAGRLDFFWRAAAGNGEFVNQPQTRAIQAGRWHRIVVVSYLEGANSSIGIYVNGKLVALKQGVAAWGAMTAQSLGLGLSPNYVGETGSYYGRYRVWKGAGIPKPGSMAAMRGVEKDYFEDGDAFPGAMVASYSLNNSVNGDVNGSPALVLAGGAAFTAAYAPSGGGTTPKRPWEMPQWPA